MNGILDCTSRSLLPTIALFVFKTASKFVAIFFALLVSLFSQNTAHAAITYFASASNPVDNVNLDLTTVVITPPGSMLTGDLVVLIANTRESGQTLAMSATGGQTWTSEAANTTTVTHRIFWARYNGTWSTNPSVSFPALANGTTLVMHVFRPTSGLNTWALDVALTNSSFNAPGGQSDVTIAGITTVTNGALVLATWVSNDNNRWGLQTAGWANAGGAQYRNGDGNDTSQSATYKVMPTAGASGNVVNRQVSRDPDAGNSSIIAFREVPLNHIRLEHTGSGVTCLPSTVTLKACVDAACSALSTSPATVTLSPATGWAVNPITFTGSATASLSVTTPSTVTLGTSAVTPVPSGTSPQCFVGATANCSLVFADTGFIFSNTPGGAVATIPTQVAGTSSGSYYLRAVKKSTTTQACEAALAGASTVNFAYECNDPTTCYGANLMSVNGGAATTIARNNNGSVSSYTSVNMTFDANGNAPFTFNYSDVGLVTLWANKAAGGTLLSALAGSSNSFVVKPAGFVLSAIKCTTADAANCGAGALAMLTSGDNPAAASAAGVSFIRAGLPFSVTVTAVNSLGNATPNYGKETAPESVKLTSLLVGPLDCDGIPANDPDCQNPNIAGNFGAFSNGVATGASFTWGEVGIIKLKPSVGDGSYLGETDVTGTDSGNVGRFYPDHFNTSITAASVMPCPTGMTCPCPPTATCPPSLTRFVYSSQPFSANVFARNAADQATRNYYAGFAKSVTLSAVDAQGGSASSVGSITVASNTVNASAFLSGTTGAGTPAAPVYVFTTTPTVPTDIYLRAIESAGGDGVTSLRNPANTSWEQGIKVVSGRIKVSNAHGSELLPLPMTATVQLFNATGSWVASDTDNVTAIANSNFALAFPVATANKLAACETALSVTGSSPNFKLNLIAPGSGNNGWTDLTLNLGAAAAGNQCTVVGGVGAASTTVNRPWLQYPVGSNPTARATFGVYKGGNNIIYLRESY